jgi:hypothetical protein
MRKTMTSRLGSYQGTLVVADQSENKPLWLNKSPTRFTELIAGARLSLADLASAGAEQSADIGGSTEALRDLRGRFEGELLVLTRATYRCLKNDGRTEDAAKVNLKLSHLREARAVDLSGLGETVLDLAEAISQPAAAGQPVPGEKYGVVAAKVAAVDELWEKYSAAVGAPIGARAKRKALTESLPGRFAAVEEQYAELDDLIIQFRGTEAGDRFVEAWFNARRVFDTGRRAGRPAESAETAQPGQPARTAQPAQPAPADVLQP